MGDLYLFNANMQITGHMIVIYLQFQKNIYLFIKMQFSENTISYPYCEFGIR